MKSLIEFVFELDFLFILFALAIGYGFGLANITNKKVRSWLEDKYIWTELFLEEIRVHNPIKALKIIKKIFGWASFLLAVLFFSLAFGGVENAQPIIFISFGLFILFIHIHYVVQPKELFQMLFFSKYTLIYFLPLMSYAMNKLVPMPVPPIYDPLTVQLLHPETFLVALRNCIHFIALLGAAPMVYLFTNGFILCSAIIFCSLTMKLALTILAFFYPHNMLTGIRNAGLMIILFFKK